MFRTLSLFLVSILALSACQGGGGDEPGTELPLGYTGLITVRDTNVPVGRVHANVTIYDEAGCTVDAGPNVTVNSILALGGFSAAIDDCGQSPFSYQVEIDAAATYTAKLGGHAIAEAE